MTDALELARGEFGRLHPHVKLQFNFASKGTLQRQIEAGAPMHLFIAAPAPMERWVERSNVRSGDVVTLASNGIVLIRPRSSDGGPGDWDELAGPGAKQIASGNPDHVPIGQYRRAVLRSLGIWDAVQSRLVPAESARQVVSYVARGEVDAGIVYASDAIASDHVVIVAEAPAAGHPPVTYLMAVPDGGPQPEAARLFAEFLLSPRGQALLAQVCFGPPND